MRIDTVYIKDFKNLKQFRINLDETQMNTVLLGQNAMGKSNFIEALILIFKHLDLGSFPPFEYEIKYECREIHILIRFEQGKYQIQTDEPFGALAIRSIAPISFSAFLKKKNTYLPKYVFTYYSGLSDRLDKLFWQHQENFYRKIIKTSFDKAELDELRRLFYVKQIHSFFVLLAFFSLPNIEQKTKDFLYDVLGIEDLESVLFVLKKPSWNNKKGDARFFGAQGLVQEFLSMVWDYSLAPIYSEDNVATDFRHTEKRTHLYLYLPDKERLKAFAEAYFKKNNEVPNNTFLFKALESTYISELLEEVKVKVKKRVDGEVTFKELSEGEQQLLTVIGLLIFTREDESLVLLDEPDTHLNPIWKYNYLHYLKSLVKSKEEIDKATSQSKEQATEDNDPEDKSTQILINTHDPLVIGSMVKAQVRIFGRSKDKASTEAIEPEVDPRGLGVDGILTSELFGLPTTLDEKTRRKLDKRNELLLKQHQHELTEIEKEELHALYDELEELGFSYTFRDPLYQKFIVAFKEKTKGLEKDKYTRQDLADQNTLALEILKELENEEEK